MVYFPLRVLSQKALCGSVCTSHTSTVCGPVLGETPPLMLPAGEGQEEESIPSEQKIETRFLNVKRFSACVFLQTFVEKTLNFKCEMLVQKNVLPNVLLWLKTSDQLLFLDHRGTLETCFCTNVFDLVEIVYECF